MPLADVLAQAAVAEQEDALVPSEVPYLNDTAYHNNAYMIEDALRKLSVLPDPAKNARPAMPYDADLKRLIASVPLE